MYKLPLETWNPLDFSRWEQVAALLIIVVGGIIWRYLYRLEKLAQQNQLIAQEARDIAEQGKVVAQEGKVLADEARSSSAAVRETLTTNNSGSHLKDQFDRLEDKVDALIELIESNKPMFKYMRDNFKHSDYFQKLELTILSMTTRLRHLEAEAGYTPDPEDEETIKQIQKEHKPGRRRKMFGQERKNYAIE